MQHPFDKQIEMFNSELHEIRIKYQTIARAACLLRGEGSDRYLPKIVEDNSYEPRWKLSLGEIDIPGKRIADSHVANGVVQTFDFEGAKLPVFVWHRRSNARGSGFDESFYKFFEQGKFPERYDLREAHAKILQPNGYWDTIAELVQGNIDNTRVLKFKSRFGIETSLDASCSYSDSVYTFAGLTEAASKTVEHLRKNL